MNPVWSPLGGLDSINIRYYMFALVFVIFDVELVPLSGLRLTSRLVGLLRPDLHAILLVALVWRSCKGARVELVMSENTSSIAAVRDLREVSWSDCAPTVTNDLSENVILTSLDDLTISSVEQSLASSRNGLLLIEFAFALARSISTASVLFVAWRQAGSSDCAALPTKMAPALCGFMSNVRAEIRILRVRTITGVFSAIPPPCAASTN